MRISDQMLVQNLKHKNQAPCNVTKTIWRFSDLYILSKCIFT